MPWCALLTAVKKHNKSLEKLQDFFFKTKTKTFIFVLEAPRDQDPGLEDYITGTQTLTQRTWRQQPFVLILLVRAIQCRRLPNA